jgi:hypothetical protein
MSSQESGDEGVDVAMTGGSNALGALKYMLLCKIMLNLVSPKPFEIFFFLPVDFDP